MSSWADQTPSDVSAVYLDDTSIRVSFTAPSGIVNPYYYYHIVVYDSSGNWYETTGTSTSYTITGLTESTTYSFYIETIQTAATGYYTTRTTQFPVIYSFTTSDVSYNAAKLNWTGLDFSFVRLVRSSGAASAGVDLSYVTSAASYYDNSTDICGNTVYYYYITPYLYLNDVLNTGAVVAASSITTKVAPPTNVSATATTDGSAITLSYTAAKNSYSNSVYYSASGAGATDVSGSGTSLLVTGLSGNTSYSFYVIVTLDSSSALVATSSAASATTAVQAPVGAVSFYDNSAILVAFSSKNTYSSILYSASVSGAAGASGASSPVLITGLSGNTVYSITVSNTLDGNSSLSASSVLSSTVTTDVQPPYDVSLYAVDGSSIALTFSAGANSYSSIVWTGVASDTSGRELTTVTGAASPIYITELSGNTTYIAKVSVTLDGNSALSATASTTIQTTTPVAPVTDLSAIFYDSSAITVSFSIGRNSYSSSIYYIAAATEATEATAATSPISITELSGNTSYSIYVKTVVDTSYNASSDTIALTTDIQPPKNPYISYYDNSAITVAFDEPKNTALQYYTATATDLSGGSVAASDTKTPINIDGLLGNTLYYVSISTVVSGNVSSSSVYVGSIQTGIIKPYDITTTEISTTDPTLASIIDVSFVAPSQSGTVYYIASVSDTITTLDASSTSSPVQVTGLSGNTSYTVTLTTVIDGTSYVSSAPSITTAIQTPVDLEIISMQDASFTVAFTTGRNAAAATAQYYILRATDVCGGAVIDVSSTSGTLSMYDTYLNTDTYYDIDLITVVDNSFVSYGGIFRVATAQLPYDIYAREISTDDPAIASYVCVYFTAPEQYQTVYYVASASASASATSGTTQVTSTTSPIHLTGLSGNTTYSITFTTVLNDTSYVSSTVPIITTAIQTPVDLEIITMEDASFTVEFTTGRNAAASTQYYILRATDLSSGAMVDVSGTSGVLSMYDLTPGEYYSVDLITVVDSSSVSYGGIFDVGA